MNSQTNLTVGDVTADEVEVEIRTPTVSIKAGEKLTYYQIEDGVENLIGVFYAEAPTIATKTSIRFKAYDGKAKLAADFSEWLNGNQDKFPMSLRTLVGHACETAGVPLAADSFQFDSLSIPAFYAQGVTCRQIVSWAAQIAGRFVSCNTAGEIFFDWYRKTDISIGKTDFSQDGLSKKAYSTDLIKRVQFKQETNDVGVIYPADADGNVFSISQNGIAAVLDSDTLRTIAQSLYEKLKSITYTPLSVKLPKRTAKIQAGDIISVTDGNGSTVSAYVMKVYLDSSGTQISSTGDQNYADKAAVSSEQYRNVPGKVLLLEKSVDGIRIENKDTTDKVATLELTVDGLKTSVKDAEGNISKIEQTAGEVHVSAKKYSTVGTKYTFSHNEAGELILTYTGEKPNYSIDEDGNLLLTHTGEKPDIWADEDGYILTTEEELGETVAIGELKTEIDGKGTWNSEFIQNGERVSALYFDFEKSRFTFDGHVVARSGEIGGCSIVGGKLQVPAANITDKLTARQIDATDLHVKAANIDGKLSFGSAYYIDPSATTNYLKLPGLEITSGGALFTGGLIRVPTSFKWTDMIYDGTQMDGQYIYLRSGGEGFVFTPTTWGYSYKNASKILAEYKNDMLKFSEVSFPGWGFGTVSITNASGNEVYNGQAMYSDEIETGTAKSKAFLTPEGVYARTEANGTVYVKHATWPQIAGIGEEL